MAVDLTLAKQHLRVDHADEDALITQYLAAAVAWVENYTGKLLTRREVTQEESGFCGYFKLFYGPIPTTLTIAYTDSADSPQTITDALVTQAKAYPASAWPANADNTAVTLTYTAGFEASPADLDAAVLVHLRAQYDEWRSGESDPVAMMAVESLCRPYRSLMV